MKRIKYAVGVTANTTGKLTSQHGLFYTYLINSFGEETAKAYLNTNEKAIQAVKEIIDTEQIECNFEWKDAFVYTNNPSETEKIRREVKTLNSLNFPAYYTENVDLPFETIGAIGFPKQAQIHARKYCLGLIGKLPENSVYENSKVIEIKKAEDGSYKTICENGVGVKSKYVVITTHYPIVNFPGMYFLKMYQDKSYIIAVDIKEELKNNLFNGMYISAEEPVTSFRTVNIDGKKLLLVGGSGHKTGDTSVDINASYENLENYIKTIYPKAEVLYKWSTEDCVTLDKIPYIGQFSNFMPNVFVATGYKKWGMTTSFVAANAIFQEIIGNRCKENEIYRATRMAPIKNNKEVGNMLKETTNSLILNKLKEPILSLEELKIGEGGIVSYNGKKIGAYKKSENEIIAVKPYCKHLGCQLSWNQLEKTWDCPCHGSRYDYMGNIITEPTKKKLEIIEIK